MFSLTNFGRGESDGQNEEVYEARGPIHGGQWASNCKHNIQ